MPRAPTTLDPFNAVAEPRRRRVLETLAGEELAVNDIVGRLGWAQPSVSKHLGVLKEVGLVRVRRGGRQGFYSGDAAQLKPFYDGAGPSEKFGPRQLDRI